MYIRKPLTMIIVLVFSIVLLGKFAPAEENSNVKTLFEDKIEKTEGIASCPDGGLFVVENESGKVYRVIDDETIELFSESYVHPAGMACDSENRLYIVEFGKGTLRKISEDGKESEIIADGLAQPNGVIVASDGTIYVSESEPGRVTAITPDGKKETLAEDVSYANGLALADNDTILYINSSLGNKTVMTPTSGKHKGKTKTFAKGLLTADGITTDGAGIFYICVFGKNQVARVNRKGETEIIASGLSGPASPALNGGALYVTSLQGKGIYKISIAEKEE